MAVREPDLPGPRSPRLLDRVRAALRAPHYSRRTEDAYVAWIKRYIFLFHDKRHPAERGAQEVTSFLSSLAVDLHVAASTPIVVRGGKGDRTASRCCRPP
jgi:hypothetical protein